MLARSQMANDSEKLAALEKRLALVESNLTKVQKQKVQKKAAVYSKEPLVSIRIHFSRVALERKPIAVAIESSEKLNRNLSSIRAAILLALLIDLLEQSESGERSGETSDRVRHAYYLFEQEDTSELSADAIRVALYRASQFFEEEISDILGSGFSLMLEKGRLTVWHMGRVLDPTEVDIEISTSDQSVSAYLDKTLATSPLMRLRRANSLYVPPGEDGQDRLVAELLDHSFPVRRVSLFYRPTIQSLPLELMYKFKFNQNRILRKKLAVSGYQSGKLHYTELIPRAALWAIGERIPGKGFMYYPTGAGLEDVIAHLDEMIFMLRSFACYELAITDAFLPFHLSTFELTKPEEIERFTLFFQKGGTEDIKQVNTFALKDDAVFFSTQDKIVNWVLSHPTTMRRKENVINEITAVRESLLSKSESPIRSFNRSSQTNSQLSDSIELQSSAQTEAEGSSKTPGNSADENPANRIRSSK